MSETLTPLIHVLHTLLGPGGCPWDKQQTPQSLTDYVLEEAFELVDAVQRGDTEEIKEELGDLLFLLLFLAELNKEHFSLEDAVEYISSKMVRRHPHVFDGLEISGKEELLSNWEKIKRREKTSEDEGPKSLYASLPKGLPPLLKAYRIHSKAARIGFTWETDEEAMQQLESEWKEWTEALDSGDPEMMEQEFGDYIFTLVEIGRRKGIKANKALHLADLKFLKRFEAMEKLAQERNIDLEKASLEEMNRLWNDIKNTESSG